MELRLFCNFTHYDTIIIDNIVYQFGIDNIGPCVDYTITIGKTLEDTLLNFSFALEKLWIESSINKYPWEWLSLGLKINSKDVETNFTCAEYKIID